MSQEKPKLLPPHIFSNVSSVSVVLSLSFSVRIGDVRKNHLKKAPLPRVLELRSFFCVNQLMTSRARRLHVLTHLIQRVLGLLQFLPYHSVYELETSGENHLKKAQLPCPAASKLLQCQSADDLKSTMTSCHNISENLRRPYEDILPMDSINFFHPVLGSLDVQKHFRGTKNQKMTLFRCDSSPLDVHACNRPYIFFDHAVTRAHGYWDVSCSCHT